jgi:hypothetical protein
LAHIYGLVVFLYFRSIPFILVHFGINQVTVLFDKPRITEDANHALEMVFGLVDSEGDWQFLLQCTGEKTEFIACKEGQLSLVVLVELFAAYLKLLLLIVTLSFFSLLFRLLIPGIFLFLALFVPLVLPILPLALFVIFV